VCVATTGSPLVLGAAGARGWSTWTRVRGRSDKPPPGGAVACRSSRRVYSSARRALQTAEPGPESAPAAHPACPQTSSTAVRVVPRPASTPGAMNGTRAQAPPPAHSLTPARLLQSARTGAVDSAPFRRQGAWWPARVLQSLVSRVAKEIGGPTLELLLVPYRARTSRRSLWSRNSEGVCR
jgi:hypothetical protein